MNEILIEKLKTLMKASQAFSDEEKTEISSRLASLSPEKLERLIEVFKKEWENRQKNKSRRQKAFEILSSFVKNSKNKIRDMARKVSLKLEEDLRKKEISDLNKLIS